MALEPAPDVWTHVGQQPIVDTSGGVVGYELLFRATSGAAAADVRDPERATAQVLATTFLEFGLSDLVGDRLAFVNLPRAFLLGQLPLPFPPGQVVLEVLEDVETDPEVVAGVTRLVEAGYRIALDDVTADDVAVDDRPGPPSPGDATGTTSSGGRGRMDLLHLADYVKLDLGSTAPADLPRLAASTARHGALLIAEKVETPQQLDLCTRLGIRLVQGYLPARPTTRTRRSLTPSQLTCLHLLDVLARPDATARDVAAAVETDPAVAVKVLLAANSAGAGLRRRVRSVEHAVTLVGRQTLQGWTTLLLLGRTARDAPLAAPLVRARNCRSLAERHAADPAAAFLTGLLSGLAAPLRTDLAGILQHLHVAQDVRDALLHDTGELAPILHAVLAYERGDLAPPPRSRLFAPEDLRRTYLDALRWAHHAQAAMASPVPSGS